MNDAPSMKRILTPEHVPILLQPAGLGSRFLALITDFFIIAAIASGIRLVFSLIPALGLGFAVGVGWAIATTLAFILQWGYHVYFEVRHQGRSPGKRLLGLRVVDGRGLPITVQQSMVRNIVRVLDFAPLFYGLGGLVALLDTFHRRLGDIAADTLVVRESQPLPEGSTAITSRRHNSLRNPSLLRRIRHRVTLEEKEFLLALCLRADGLEDAARYDLMETVGETYRRKLEIDDPHLSNENLVRGLTAVLFSDEGRGFKRA